MFLFFSNPKIQTDKHAQRPIHLPLITGKNVVPTSLKPPQTVVLEISWILGIPQNVVLSVPLALIRSGDAKLTRVKLVRFTFDLALILEDLKYVGNWALLFILVLCPPFTEALRMGKKAYETISAPLQTYDEAKATCEAKGGFLPIVKTMKDFENHVFARWLKGGEAKRVSNSAESRLMFSLILVLNDRYWTSLKQSNNPQACSNAACNAQDIQWADGSQFVYEDLNKPITGRTTSTCFAINSNMLIPSLGGLVGFDCTAKLSVICEYSCT